MGIKVIITGSTGMVGEGVLLECLQNSDVEKVLILNRKSYSISDPKLEEILIKDFFDLNSIIEKVKDFDACFFCAGISSVGMNEADYTKVTYDMTLSVAEFLSKQNPDLVFNYISGQSTDSSENGKIMWARVKGKTENDLLKLPFKAVYNFSSRYQFKTQVRFIGNYRFLWQDHEKGHLSTFPISQLILLINILNFCFRIIRDNFKF